jgi:polysaccharide export outer membrane protein
MIRSSLLLAALLLGACSSSPSILKSSALPVVQNAALPPPAEADGMRAARPYNIGPMDRLSIDVFGMPEVRRDNIQVDASGQISFPLVGSIAAVGRTPDELASEIEAGLRSNHVRNPQVSVNLIETVSRVVTVDGQVTRPGLYPAVGSMTLMRAVAVAGGMSEFANLEDVVVFRTVDGQRMAGLYNLKAIRAGTYADPEVYADDVIVVGDSPSRRLFRDVIQGSSLLTTPLLLLFNRN